MRGNKENGGETLYQKVRGISGKKDLKAGAKKGRVSWVGRGRVGNVARRERKTEF